MFNITNKWLGSAIILSALLSVIFMSTADAQYFGRNKVNYNDFNFKILHTKHFKLYYYSEEKNAVKYAAEMAERWYARHSTLMDDTLEGPQALILYDGFQQFSETNVTQGMIGQGTGGFTEPVERRIVLPFAGPLEETNHVIGHELVHAFQFDITGKKNMRKDGLPAASEMPLWFIEGMAEYFSIGPDDPNTAMWMREAAKKKIPDISDLENPKYFPYRYGQALLAYMGGKYGDKKIVELLRVSASLGSMKRGIDSVFHISADSLSKEWHKALHASYDSLAKITEEPSRYGPVLISKKKEGGDINVSPVLSPDGKKVMFFSSKDLFSIDLFLADAKTGKVEKNVFKSELNTHLQNLEFINSAGAWSPDGKQFVFSAISNGRPVLSLLDVNNGDIKREIRFPKLAEIFNPAWSPDGRYIAFSALDGGLNDLFMYDLKTDSLHRLTHDPFAELQPAWSPDGKNLVYVTDEFSTHLSNLKFGNYRLAIMNPFTRSIKKLPGFDNGKNINPQWSPDGKSIYFISDQNGIDNIYRLDIADGKIDQLTNLYGGVSGITALSPAMSVAQNSDEMVYSVFENGDYAIYSIDSTKILEGKKLNPEFATGNPALLPPVKRKSPLFVDNLKNPNIGMPSDSTLYEVSNYHPSLMLTGVGQPSLGAGVDQFGTYLGGSVALFWSDMLGNYNLATALQIQSGNGFTDISGLVGYMNTAHRWNYGAVIQQVPYYLSGYNAGYGLAADSTPTYFEQQYIYRETNRQISGILSYPFNQSLRVEFSAGYRNISFDNEVITDVFDANGFLVQNSTQKLPHQSSLNLGTFSAALVFDNSYFGATSPILGSRYRLEVDPVIGSLDWINVLADYRQYFMPIRPFTIAARILHDGRYGKSADNYNVSPMYLGYPGLVRGYESSSFTSSNSDYQVFNNLLGSKMLVANLELRFPLLGVFHIGPGYYGYFPVEFAAFYDAGVAWYNDQKPSFMGGTRTPVTSVGAALRINLFGYAVGEVDYVRPLSRPTVGWLWQFNIIEGF